MSKIKRAFSTSNGIVLYSVKNPRIGLFTYISDTGEIVSEQLSEKEIDNITFGPSIKKKLMLLNIIINIIVLTISLLFSHIFCGIYFVFTISYLISNFLFLCFDKNRKKFHSVEHMIVNCYNNGLDLTKSNIKKCSRFNKNCGSLLVFKKIIARSIIFIIMWTTGTKYWLLCVVLFLFFSTVLQFFPIFLPIQFLVTCKPSEKELNLGYIAITKFAMLELGK